MAFDYSGKIYYLNDNRIKLRNIFTKTDELEEPFKLYHKKEIRNSSYTMGCDDKIIVIVAKFYDNKFTRLVFNHKLESVDIKYDIIDDTNCTIDFLEREMEISHGIQSIRKKYGESVYPHKFLTNHNGIAIIDFDRSYSSYASTIGCYDKYNDTLVTVEVEKEIVRLYVWKKEDQDWKTLKKLRFFDMVKEKIMQIKINHLECSRHHIFIHIWLKSYLSFWESEFTQHIWVLDKYTYKKIDQFVGTCPSHVDNYKEWYDERLTFLSKIEMIEKMSVSLLKIILSYVA